MARRPAVKWLIHDGSLYLQLSQAVVVEKGQSAEILATVDGLFTDFYVESMKAPMIGLVYAKAFRPESFTILRV